MRILLRRGRVLAPSGKWRDDTDVAISGDTIVAVGPSLKFDADYVIHCEGLEVLPGLIDIHAHSREPGAPEKESIESLARAAANGGVTTVVTMPNTEPAIDRPEWVKYVRLRSCEVGGVDILPAAALTIGRRGEQLAPYGLLREAGVTVFTDDGTHIQDAGLMREALEALRVFKGVVMIHPEDTSLSRGGLINEGVWAERHGIPGIPWVSETAIVARDSLLAAQTGCRVHFTHISSAWSIKLLSQFRRWRMPVSADVTFHHLYFDESDLSVPDRMWKVNPPLRSAADRMALRSALVRGQPFDYICTDHAPHGEITDTLTFEDLPFGFSSIDLAFPLLNSLFAEDEVPFARRLRWMTVQPATLLNERRKGAIAEGFRADIIVVDRKKEITVQREHLLSRGKNCPYVGKKLRGQVLWTICGGRIVKEEGKVTVRTKNDC